MAKPNLSKFGTVQIHHRSELASCRLSPPAQAGTGEPLLRGRDRRDLPEQKALVKKAGAAQGEPTGPADSGESHLIRLQSSVRNASSCIDYCLCTPSRYLEAENAHHYPWVYQISSSILLSPLIEEIKTLPCLGKPPRKAEVPIATGVSGCANSHMTFSIENIRTGHFGVGKYAGHPQWQLWRYRATGHHSYMQQPVLFLCGFYPDGSFWEF